MSKRSPYIFVEGETELRLLRIIGCPVEPKNCKGKDRILEAIEEDLKGDVGKKPISILILRDRDNKEISGIIRSFELFFNKLLKNENVSTPPFRKHNKFDNLYLLDIEKVDFRVILHIAAPSYITENKFDSDTIDGYVFALAMCDQVLQRFAKDAKITSEILKNKVLVEVPELAKKNGIEFNQAKDMLGIYMAMSRFLKVKKSEDDDKFSGFVVKRAKDYANMEYQTVLSSIMIALELLETNAEVSM